MPGTFWQARKFKKLDERQARAQVAWSRQMADTNIIFAANPG
jgi:hypothetical protein